MWVVDSQGVEDLERLFRWVRQLEKNAYKTYALWTRVRFLGVFNFFFEKYFKFMCGKFYIIFYFIRKFKCPHMEILFQTFFSKINSLCIGI
jgi:hypothetical protein